MGGSLGFASCCSFPSPYRRDVEDAVPYGETEAGALCGERRVYAVGAVHERPAPYAYPRHGRIVMRPLYNTVRPKKVYNEVHAVDWLRPFRFRQETGTRRLQPQS